MFGYDPSFLFKDSEMNEEGLKREEKMTTAIEVQNILAARKQEVTDKKEFMKFQLDEAQKQYKEDLAAFLKAHPEDDEDEPVRPVKRKKPDSMTRKKEYTEDADEEEPEGDVNDD